ETPRVLAHVEDHATHSGFFEALELGSQLGARGAGESPGDLHQADPIGAAVGSGDGQEVALNTLERDDGAADLVAERFGDPFAADMDDDGRVGRTLEQRDRVVEILRHGRLTVDLDDSIAGLKSDLLGRGTVEDAQDGDGVVADTNLDTETAEAAFGALVHLPERLGS